MTIEHDAGMETLATHMVTSIVKACSKAGLDAQEALADVRQFYVERQRASDSLFLEMGQEPEPFARKLTDTILAAIDLKLFELGGHIGRA